MNRLLIVVAVLLSLGGVLTVGGFAQTTGPSDAWIPGLASLCVPGFGQLLNDEVDKAIIHFGVFIAIDIGILVLFPWHYYGYSYRSYVFGLAHLAWAIYSGLDAYNIAKDTGFSLGMTEDGLTLSYSF